MDTKKRKHNRSSKKLRWKRCPYCQIKFLPHCRLGERQITCGSKACKKTHRAKYRRKYRKTNKQEELDYKEKSKRFSPEGYWRKYRKEHPDYMERERIAAKIRKKRAKTGSQCQPDTMEELEITMKNDKKTGSQCQRDRLFNSVPVNRPP